MKKAPAALVSTAAGFAAVLALHGSTQGSPLAVGSSPTTSSPPTTGAGSSPNGTGSSSSTSSTLPGALLSAVGTNEQYGYGELSVKVSVKGHRIMDVTVVGLQTAEQYSQSLAQQVIPMLKSEVLSAQSANVNTISGATYTSQAYLAALQSALDRLHV